MTERRWRKELRRGLLSLKIWEFLICKKSKREIHEFPLQIQWIPCFALNDREWIPRFALNDREWILRFALNDRFLHCLATLKFLNYPLDEKIAVFSVFAVK